MNLLFTLLIVLALLTALANVGLLFMWLKGIGSLVFPAVGLLIAIPMAVILSSIFQLVFTILAVVVDRYRSAPSGFLMRSL
jgi:hypothetical protein